SGSTGQSVKLTIWKLFLKMQQRLFEWICYFSGEGEEAVSKVLWSVFVIAGLTRNPLKTSVLFRGSRVRRGMTGF
ncbi:MAG: hypothetical protein LBP98_09275, partial [Tannerella sp.]|nr:hypothetical protein [Tannerella sp.]